MLHSREEKDEKSKAVKTKPNITLKVSSDEQHGLTACLLISHIIGHHGFSDFHLKAGKYSKHPVQQHVSEFP